MIKRFCDRCETDITEEERYILSCKEVKERVATSSTLTDICSDCKKCFDDWRQI